MAPGAWRRAQRAKSIAHSVDGELIVETPINPDKCFGAEIPPVGGAGLTREIQYRLEVFNPEYAIGRGELHQSYGL